MPEDDVRYRKVVLAAFFLLIFGVTQADASLTKPADVADLSRLAPQLPAVGSPDARFGFAEDLALLNVEKELPRFSLIEGVETRRFERTYARNNPLKYVDPDGRAVLEATLMRTALVAAGGVGGLTLGGAAFLVGSAFVAADVMRPKSIVLNAIADVTVNGLRAERTDDKAEPAPGTKEPTTAVGKAKEGIESTIKTGEGAWEKVDAKSEPAVSKAEHLKGGTSTEEKWVNKETGETVYRHTIEKSGKVEYETFRTYPKVPFD